MSLFFFNVLEPKGIDKYMGCGTHIEARDAADTTEEHIFDLRDVKLRVSQVAPCPLAPV